MGCAADVTKGCSGDGGSVFFVCEGQRKIEKERNSHSDLSISGKDQNSENISGPL